MKFSGKKIIAAKAGNILPYFKVNLSDSQTLPLSQLALSLGEPGTAQPQSVTLTFVIETLVYSPGQINYVKTTNIWL